jgi:hypothetical protein
MYQIVQQVFDTKNPPTAVTEGGIFFNKVSSNRKTIDNQ